MNQSYPLPNNNLSQTTSGAQQAESSQNEVNRKRIKTRSAKPIERDQAGKPVLPVKVGKVHTVLCLGEIQIDDDRYHSEKYIYPVGYKTQRHYPSLIHPDRITTMTSTILRGDNGPIFEVRAEDQPNEPLTGSMSRPWTTILEKLNNINNRRGILSRADRPFHFGMTDPTFMMIIQELPGAKDLYHYICKNIGTKNK